MRPASPVSFRAGHLRYAKQKSGLKRDPYEERQKSQSKAYSTLHTAIPNRYGHGQREPSVANGIPNPAPLTIVFRKLGFTIALLG